MTTFIQTGSGTRLINFTREGQIVLTRHEQKLKGAISSWIQKIGLKKILSNELEDRKEVQQSFHEICKRYKVTDIVSRSKTLVMLEEVIRSSKEVDSDKDSVVRLLRDLGDELQKDQLIDPNQWSQVAIKEKEEEFVDLLKEFESENSLLRKRIELSIEFYNDLMKTLDETRNSLSEQDDSHDLDNREVVLAHLRSMAKKVVNELSIHRESLEEIKEQMTWAQQRMKDKFG